MCLLNIFFKLFKVYLQVEVLINRNHLAVYVSNDSPRKVIFMILGDQVIVLV